jgi:hypothetical protein
MPTIRTTRGDSGARQILYDVFLSHHSSDKPSVETIAAQLEDEAGLKPFLDKWHLVPGEPWEEEVEAALDKSATCAVFLGPSGLGAWHNEEMRAALDERVRTNSFRVIPILLPGAEPKDKETLPRFLRRLTWVDFRAGVDNQEAFHRLVAGIKGLPPGRQVSSLNSAPSPSKSFNRVSLSSEGEPRRAGPKEKKPRAEMWKIVAGAVLALLLSTSFIGAAIPRYKLQIKSPAFKREGVYEAPTGTVIVRWAMSKEQWFREIDVSDIKANVTIKRFGDEKEELFQDSLGEVKTTLRPGKYEVRIDASEHQRSETIALDIIEPPPSSPTLDQPKQSVGSPERPATRNDHGSVSGLPSNRTPKPHGSVDLTIHGQVIDAQSEEPIQGVRVCFKWDCQNGTLTNEHGEFILHSFRPNEPESKLIVRKLGYKAQEPWYYVGDTQRIRLVRD